MVIFVNHSKKEVMKFFQLSEHSFGSSAMLILMECLNTRWCDEEVFIDTKNTLDRYGLKGYHLLKYGIKGDSYKFNSKEEIY